MPDLASDLHAARIVMVDDEEANLRLLRRILEPAGYAELHATTDPGAVVELCHELEPDLVLMDLRMPGLGGIDVLNALRDAGDEGDYLPVLLLTSDTSVEARRQALAAGAQDFLTKPLSPAEVRLRVRNLLQTRFLHRQLQENNRLLEQRVRERTAELEAARVEILDRLARAAEYRDDKTGQHTRRVGAVSAAIARALGLGEDEVELIRRVAPLHDVGKIAIPDVVLLSPERLTPAEFEVMKSHTTIGGDLLGGSEFMMMRRAEEIARFHHERWDGAGYPHGLGGDAIPLAGRIVAVADTFDALTHSRPYKRAWSLMDGRAELERESGRHFDPEVVSCFMSVLRDRGVGVAQAAG